MEKNKCMERLYRKMPLIEISQELLEELENMKNYPDESIEDVIWDLIEDCKELDEETRRELEEAIEDLKNGNYYLLDKLKKELERDE